MSQRTQFSIGMTKVTGGCRCGNSFVIEANHSEDVIAAERLFWSLHSGEGHRPCDRDEARRIMRRKAAEVPN